MPLIRFIKQSLPALLMLCCTTPTLAQQGINVLFVGNSYTEVNNLPGMVQQIAASVGDQMRYQSNTPGGCTFNQHCTNRSMELICGGGWDIVVLQEQSQYPSFPQSQVEAEVFPYAQRLVDSVYKHNPCCEPMFYMTWGRKNGDQRNAPYFPVLGTYEGMDSMLCERYTYMSQQYDAALCPVGRVWRHLRTHHADIELYQSDESHPSQAGTYAAACAFYALFFHRDPRLIAYDASLPMATATAVREAVYEVVYGNLGQWQRPQPQALLSVETSGDRTAAFTSSSLHADSLTWHFGDGTSTATAASQTTVAHRYADTGQYSVTLVASRHCMTDTAQLTIHLTADSTASIPSGTETQTVVNVYPNPASERLTVELTPPAQGVLTVYNGEGIAVWRQAVNGDTQVNLPIAHWPSGEYTLHLESNAGTLSRKVMVCR